VFHNPDVVPVVRAMGGVVVIQALQITSDALLRRDFRFRQTSLTSMFAFVAGYLVIGIGAAVAGAGVWSLVMAPFVAGAVSLAGLYRLARHPLRPLLRIDALRSVGGYGGRLTVINLLEFAGMNIDTFAVGRYAGAALLGDYNRVFNLTIFPLSLLSGGLKQVLFAGFSRVQEDLRRLRRAFVSAVSINAAVLFPVCAGAAVASRELVIATLGPKYGAAIDALPYLAAAGAFGMTSRLYGALTEALARLRARMLLQAVYLAVLVAAMLAVAGGPLWRYAAVLAGCETVRHLAYLTIAARLIRLSAGDVARMYGRPLLAAAIVAASSMTGRALLASVSLGPTPLLIADVAIDAVAVLAMLRLGVLRFVLDDLRGRLAGSGSPLETAMSSRPFRALFGPSG
jgi:PST family polysaccharide transporter